MIVLRTVTLLNHKLLPVVNDFKSVFGLEVGYEDKSDGMVKRFGLTNCMLPVGTQFIEAMESLREGTPGAKFLQRQGEGGYMFVVQTDDPALQDVMVDRAAQMGIRVVFDVVGQKEEGFSARHIQFHPADTRGSFFQIDYETANELYGHFESAGGRRWQKAMQTDLVTGIAAVEVHTAADVEQVAKRWSELIGIPLRKNKQGHQEIPLEGSCIRFAKAADGMGDGLGAMDIKVKNIDRVIENAKRKGVSTNGSQVVIGGFIINLVQEGTVNTYE